jgi:hypothetical protein
MESHEFPSTPKRKGRGGSQHPRSTFRLKEVLDDENLEDQIHSHTLTGQCFPDF